MSRTVLVTGGTGFLGEQVVRTLLGDHGGNGQPRLRVRVMARAETPFLADLPVQLVRGDVTSADDCRRAVAGCDAVFHLAGLVSRDPDDGQRMMRIHVDGTRRLLEAAHQVGVRRVVLASTSGTIAVSRDPVVHDEGSPYATEVVAGWPYYASKIFQEKAALELAAQLGLELVVVNPSLLLGPGDRRLSSTGDVLRFLRRQIPIVPPGGLNFVDVRDAAQATVAALERGQPGQRYLLGGPNWSFADFFGRLERVAKIAAPRLRMPSRLSRWGAVLVEQVYRARGSEPPVDRISVEMSQHYWYLDAGKAGRELGFAARDPALTLVDTVKYLQKDIGG